MHLRIHDPGFAFATVVGGHRNVSGALGQGGQHAWENHCSLIGETNQATNDLRLDKSQRKTSELRAFLGKACTSQRIMEY